MPTRFIKGNKGTEAPSNLVFVDTESHQRKTRGPIPRTVHSLRLWCATRVRLENGRVSRRVTAASTKQADFWKWLERYSDPHRSTWVFAHNLGFDLTLLGFWKELDRGAFTLRPLFRRDKAGNPTANCSWAGKLVLDTRVTFAKVRTGSKRYVLVDTCNYWTSTLADIGTSYGLPKLAMPEQADPAADWLVYCERDVAIVERSVCDLITRWTNEQCGVFQTTAASLAFTSWRHSCDIRRADGETLDVLCEPDSEAHKMERASYFGGRVQVYQRGEIAGPLYHVDVNSLYPAVMRDNLFPRRFVREHYAPSVDELATKLSAFGIVAELFISTTRHTFPVRIDGRQYHCRGDYWTTLAGPELRRALQTGSVAKIGLVQYYSVARLFKRWVDYWYGRKLRAQARGEAGRAERAFCNTILKSLSGKFAQGGRRWLDQPGKVALERWGGYCEAGDMQYPSSGRPSIGNGDGGIDLTVAKKKWVQCRGIAGHKQVLDDSHEPPHSFPLISSYITSYAREYMYDAIARIGEENVYYMATDSLIVNQHGYDRLTQAGLIDPYALGKFKLVGRHEYGEIIGCNHYSLNGTLTVAGWEARSRAGPRGVPVCDVWERLPSIVSKGPIDTVTVSTLPTGRSAHDVKGRVDYFGRWIPYYLCDDPLHSDRPPKGGYTDDDFTRLISAGPD